MVSASAPARVAYVLLGNPFLHERNSPLAPLMNGRFPARSTLSIHFNVLYALLGPALSSLAGVLLLMPSDDTKLEVPGYRTHAWFGSVETIPVNNNSLGSYGMYLHAFATTRGRFDYYIFCEDDYVPARSDFVTELVFMYEQAFGAPPQQQHGVLAGLLQGRPAEPQSKYGLHLETSHIMSAASLEQIYRHTFGTVVWRGSLADRMNYLVRAIGRDNHYAGGAIQEGFGLLLADCGIGMRDWSVTYRSPYWNHRRVVDWSGAASNFTLPTLGRCERSEQALFLPTQYYFVSTVTNCCGGSQGSCHRPDQKCLQRTGAVTSDCCRTSAPRLPAAYLNLRSNLSVIGRRHSRALCQQLAEHHAVADFQTSTIRALVQQLGELVPSSAISEAEHGILRQYRVRGAMGNSSARMAKLT